MTDALAAPLVPPECDLSDFQYMELDVRRLRDSKFSATPSGDAFRAGVMLWCAAWHQIPAASLPDDDVELANLAGFGKMPAGVKQWRKLRTEALNGFVKCSDGRLYHTVIAEKALTAFAAKRKHAYDKFLERLRKENLKRSKEEKPAFGIPTMEQWNSGAYPHGIPPPLEQLPEENAAASGGIPAENVLRGNGDGTEQNGTETIAVPNGTGDLVAKPAADLTKSEMWWAGKSLLHEQGMPKPQCGTFIGKLVSDYGDEIVVEAVRATCVQRPADAAEYLKGCCMRAAGQRATPRRPTSHTGLADKDYSQGINANGTLA